MKNVIMQIMFFFFWIIKCPSFNSSCQYNRQCFRSYVLGTVFSMGKTVVNERDSIPVPKDLVGSRWIKIVNVYCFIWPTLTPFSGQLIPSCSHRVILMGLLTTKGVRWPRSAFSEYYIPLATMIGSREVAWPKPELTKSFLVFTI